MEIERQFLVSALPDLPAEFDTLEQGYVTLAPEIRFRSVNHERFYLTVKRGAGLSREEWETKITAVEYENLKERLFPGTCVIRKRRYHLPLSDGHTAELFVHDGHLSGLNYVEVEFAAESEARA
ncbi:MAG: adenylate cyclase, partial [Oribacterium sp.]|nr:adenylate cyclase [Oribacterium sp.]